MRHSFLPSPRGSVATHGGRRPVALAILMAVGMASWPTPRALAQGTAFTYQGRLADNARPANGTYDLSFSLYPQATDGSRIGPVLSFPATSVTNGLFSLPLDFGQGSFNADERWIELSVRTNGAASFTTLAPRRRVLASPQAQFAASAANAQAVPASGVSGVLSLANLPALAADGSLLTNLTASALVGTAPSATNFTGPLLGDITGSQAASVVSTVGGLAAAQVALGASRANASTPEFACDVIIRRDPGDGGFTAGPIRAASFTGDGSGLTNLPTSPNMYGAPKGAVIASLIASDPALTTAGYRMLMTIPAPGWTAGATLNAPTARYRHTAVWDGSRMIIWGGLISAGNPTGTGAWYEPATDAWTAVSTVGAPSSRSEHTAVWTGSQMVVWGGLGSLGYLGSGSRFTPGTGQWAATTSTGAPTARHAHVAAWTGTRMVVWGGRNASGLLNDGGLYDPVSNTWTALPTEGAPEARMNATAVWSGSALYVWGGTGENGEVATGAILGFSGDTPTGWTALPTLNAPLGRVGHTAVWAGDRMMVWGGSAGGVPLGDGGAYCLGCGDWSTVSMTNAPLARSGHAAVWTGSEMLVVGGANAGGDVAGPAAYDPVTREWRALSGLGGPLARTGPVAAWTSTDLLVFGGTVGGTAVGTMQRLFPQPEWYFYRKL